MDADDLLALPAFLAALGLPPEAGGVLHLEGGPPLWRGPFAVDDLAVSAVAAAGVALARLVAAVDGGPVPRVDLDATHAAAAFRSESLLEPQGWALPPVWDPVAGDYRAADGWIRLHTNYRHHRAAALAVLGLEDRPDLDATAVGPAVASWPAEDLEAAVVAAGGVAGRQRSTETWAEHPAGRAVATEPVLAAALTSAAPRPTWATRRVRGAAPLAGIRVLDLTRVLAGPTATGFLAAWGADVLRIDPPGFAEVPAIVPVVAATKRTATLALATPDGRSTFRALLADADVVVHGYRPGALAGLGLDPSGWHDVAPGLVEVAIDAYGWTGPWAGRRGFDSIVQHSVGITRRGAEVLGAEQPVALPCQALDHGAGWLAGAAAVAGLATRAIGGSGSSWRTSLAAVAGLLRGLGEVGDPHRPPPTLDEVAARCPDAVVVASTAWGPLRRLSWPGRVGGLAPRLGHAGPLGAGPATWVNSRAGG